MGKGSCFCFRGRVRFRSGGGPHTNSRLGGRSCGWPGESRRRRRYRLRLRLRQDLTLRWRCSGWPGEFWRRLARLDARLLHHLYLGHHARSEHALVHQVRLRRLCARHHRVCGVRARRGDLDVHVYAARRCGDGHLTLIHPELGGHPGPERSLHCVVEALQTHIGQAHLEANNVHCRCFLRRHPLRRSSIRLRLRPRPRLRLRLRLRQRRQPLALAEATRGTRWPSRARARRGHAGDLVTRGTRSDRHWMTPL
mmetsp:Transcript_38820/g.89465  ORF Transcript_38820/g.89465 Transcript_38820/m.89465 type:complete len:253 (-) Transcript_38820:1162-1920(-)